MSSMHKRPVVAADAGYGDDTAFRLGLTGRGWHYVLAVQGTTSAHPRDPVPETMACGGPGPPGVPRHRPHPVTPPRPPIPTAATPPPPPSPPRPHPPHP